MVPEDPGGCWCSASAWTDLDACAESGSNLAQQRDAHTRLQPADIGSNPMSCSRVLELTLAIFRAVRRKQNTTAEFHDVEEGGGQCGDAAERKIWVERLGISE